MQKGTEDGLGRGVGTDRLKPVDGEVHELSPVSRGQVLPAQRGAEDELARSGATVPVQPSQRLVHYCLDMRIRQVASQEHGAQHERRRLNVPAGVEPRQRVTSWEVVYVFPPDSGVWPGVGVSARI